jgi:hypothetical protein
VTTRWATLFAGAVAVLAIVAGIVRGVPVAGGADSSGYLNQGRLWAAGRLHVDVPLALELGDLLPFEAFAPLGFRTSVDGRQLVPVYPPGLPMAMGLGERLGGHRAAFLLVPLLGRLAVWTTFLMGRRVADHPTGLVASILLATSPAFATALMFPESDVAVTAWWALSLALLARPGGAPAAVASGLSAGAAVLTRLNLVPLAIVPGTWLLWHTLRARTRVSLLRAAGFAAGLLPACLTAAWLNTRLYGSPLRSGYGSLEGFFAWSHFWPNLERYPAWILDALTPIVLLGAWRVSRSRAFVATVMAPRSTGRRSGCGSPSWRRFSRVACGTCRGTIRASSAFCCRRFRRWWSLLPLRCVASPFACRHCCASACRSPS